ncbi:hypothetical protein [Acidicapsa acidisoli]|uniref:hypothetical protein n=1 Tax=Acidicapsa acidisoli TaxID=1615681 RepID=UPI0021DF4273|nr:hypothetical protein [Acidicapsa acidisoli]
MPTERSQILTLLAAHRLDVAEAERLLAAAGTRERFFAVTLALTAWTLAAVTLTSITQLHPHLSSNLTNTFDSALQSITRSAAFHHLLAFCYRLLGELP